MSESSFEIEWFMSGYSRLRSHVFRVLRFTFHV